MKVQRKSGEAGETRLYPFSSSIFDLTRTLHESTNAEETVETGY